MLNRAKIVKELEPGLNAIFGGEYDGYDQEHIVLFDVEGSDRAFEEEVLWTGLAGAVVKPEGAGVSYDDGQESWVARYNHETIALAFSITEEAIEDNLYESSSKRLSKALARSMAHTKQVKGASVYNNAFASSGYNGGDGVSLLNTSHPLITGATSANKPTTDVDLSETGLENAAIDISNFTDDRGIPSAFQPVSLHIPTQSIFIAERLLKSQLRVQSAENDINALNNMGLFSGGAQVNHRFTDTDAWFVRTDCPDSMKHFERVKLSTKMEGEFETGNDRYKARERYSSGWSDWRGLYGSKGA